MLSIPAPNKELERIFGAEPDAELATPLRDIILRECDNAKIAPPKRLYEKRSKNWFGGGLSGYTSYYDGGEITLIYTDDPLFKWLYSPREWEETETALHEVTHWLRWHSSVNNRIVDFGFDLKNDGHSNHFYADLTEKVLEYGIPVKEYYESEYAYKGDIVTQGMEIFDRRWNRVHSNANMEALYSTLYTNTDGKTLLTQLRST